MNPLHAPQTCGHCRNRADGTPCGRTGPSHTASSPLPGAPPLVPGVPVPAAGPEALPDTPSRLGRLARSDKRWVREVEDCLEDLEDARDRLLAELDAEGADEARRALLLSGEDLRENYQGLPVERAHTSYRYALRRLGDAEAEEYYHLGYRQGSEAPSARQVEYAVLDALAALKRDSPRTRSWRTRISPLAMVVSWDYPEGLRDLRRFEHTKSSDVTSPDAVRLIDSSDEVRAVSWIAPAGASDAQREVYRSLRRDGTPIREAANLMRVLVPDEA